MKRQTEIPPIILIILIGGIAVAAMNQDKLTGQTETKVIPTSQVGFTRQIIYSYEKGITGQYVHLLIDHPEQQYYIKNYAKSTTAPPTILIRGKRYPAYIYEIIPYQGKPIVIIQTELGTIQVSKETYSILRGQ